MNQREPPLRGRECRKKAHPCSEALGTHDMGCGARPIRCGPHSTFGKEGWVGDDLVVAFALEAGLAQRLGRPGHVDVDRLESVGEAVACCIVLRQRAKRSVDLDRRYFDIGDAREQAKTCNADAGADIEHPLAAPRRHRGGKKHSVTPSPVSDARLHDTDAAAEKVVGARCLYHRLTSCLRLR